MSQKAIQNLIEIVRNETELHANTKERIATLLTLLNTEKMDRSGVEGIISEITNLSPLFFDQFGNILDSLTQGWTLQYSDEEYIDSLAGRKVIRKVTGYVGGTGSVPASLSANIGKYFAKAGGFTTVKADATIYETSDLLVGNATQANAPTPYDAVTYPDGLFEKYQAKSIITSPNSWGNLTVTQLELDNNYVFFDVNNGVVTKVLSAKIADINNITNITNENTYALDPSQIVPSEALYNDIPETLAGDILKRVDKTSGVDVNYRKSVEAFIGKNISEELRVKFPTIFKKVDSDYFKIQNDSLFNIKMFGAKGDGITDDSDAFQNAADFCELFSVKTLSIPYGNYFLSKPIVWNRGGVKIQGQGGFGREESWIGYSTGTYPQNFPLGITDTYLGCTITVPKNSTAFVYSESVVDAVYIDGISFIAKEGRTVGKTNAIDFHATFGGPAWTFKVSNCYFRGFNRAINFESTTQYCVAFIDFSHNSMAQNDEVLYFADLAVENWSTLGSRNIAWGLNFEHNKCHDNARLIRGSFAKDLVNIKQNNLEGLIPYADGTYPKYAIDLELSNCTVNFEGNHSEGTMIQDNFFATSYFRKPDGTRHSAENNNTSGGACFVKLSGNNYDGIDGCVAVTLEGVGIIDSDFNYIKKIHSCSIISTLDRSSFQLSNEALINPTMFSFPLSQSGEENFSKDSQASNISSGAEGIFNHNSNIVSTPIGLRQVNNADAFNGALFNYTGISARDSTEFYGITFLIKVVAGYNFFGAVVFYTNLGVFELNQKNSTFSKGWNLVTCILPKNNRLITSVSAGISLVNLGDKRIIIDSNITTFTIDKKTDINVMSYFIQNKIVFKKKGTFNLGQSFLDDTGVYNVCTKNGTIGEELVDVKASSEIGNNFFTCNNPNKLAIGAYIDVTGFKYQITNIIENKVYINAPFYQGQGNDATVVWDAAEFKTITLT